MHFVLVNPPNPNRRPPAGAWPPLGLGYMAATLEQFGHRCTIIDALVPRLSPQQVVRVCRELEPDCVGVSFFSPSLDMSAAIVDGVRAVLPEATVVGGGPHATLRPVETMAEIPGLDYLLCGEAEQSIEKFALYLQGRKTREDVPGLVYRSDGRVIVNPWDSPAIISAPKRPWLSGGASRSPYFNVIFGAVDSIMTARGCPYGCSFCSKYGQTYRRRSTDDVLRELEELQRIGVRNLDVFDDTFSADIEHCSNLLEAITAARLGLRFRIRLRADHVTDQLMCLARDAGVIVVSIGMESGSQRVLDAMGKRTTLEMNRRAAETVKRHGLLLTTSWLIGSIAETPESLRATADFIRRIRPTLANVHRLLPLPGTTEYNRAKEKGMLQGEWSVGKPQPWIKLSWMRNEGDLDRAVQYVRAQYQADYAALAWFWLNNPPRPALRIATQAMRFASGRLGDLICSARRSRNQMIEAR